MKKYIIEYNTIMAEYWVLDVDRHKVLYHHTDPISAHAWLVNYIQHNVKQNNNVRVKHESFHS